MDAPTGIARIGNPALGYDLMMCNSCGRFLKERPRRGLGSLLVERTITAELDVAAESDDNAKKTNGKCPASFFVGLDAVRRGDKQRAREQLQLAQARCPTTSTYNWAASSALQRL